MSLYKNLHAEVLFCTEPLMSEYQKENTDKLEVYDFCIPCLEGGEPHETQWKHLIFNFQSNLLNTEHELIFCHS